MSKIKRKFINKNIKHKHFCRGKKQSRFCGMAMILMGIMVIGMVGFYVYSVSIGSVHGYKIAELEDKKEKLADTYAKLEVKKIGLEQISRIEKEAKEMGMGPADNSTKEYLGGEEVVAKR